ncbi:universal stress protein [Haloarchaeobius iranensis]|uniref:Nucleotide-binding universal stress protein, UspA family n=1 Tax=Haloarchaeobius iranensis TaxID=996166 RepID=A0A1G9W0P9_9EURY|nr:universal stress protein [Haloarchaeobius iranensis]SDM78082.1 Nucleotide-binding universal stress protein, UspA family [Haloarchaeobius iranensis]
MAPDHVLVPLDGSPLADRALVHALETFDCRTTVLNVVTPLDRSMSESGILDADEDREESAEDRAETIIERGKRRAAEHGRTVETAVETGDPAETIVEFAESSAVDHIVMGGHGGERNALAARLLGTVATTVVSEATTTVTVVRD